MIGEILTTSAVLAIAPAFAITVAFLLVVGVVADYRRDGELF